MVKILLAILFTILLIALGFYYYGSGDSSSSSGSDTPRVSNPADTIDRADNAVQQSQDLQNKVNTKIDNQYAQ
ncbi:hypothetical protein COU91_02175 [Candidatus Saccharibacteria bacterium CG10_big_fil_rev_8_21_14_0_10_47_8]|nr:MAG: hypothetical protein COU91_02175 [Candidatus Saccharibacteria bacterium CG10_big_fil_rev_8_21_14_0_10_47_8]